MPCNEEPTQGQPQQMVSVAGRQPSTPAARCLASSCSTEKPAERFLGSLCRLRRGVQAPHRALAARTLQGAGRGTIPTKTSSRAPLCRIKTKKKICVEAARSAGGFSCPCPTAEPAAAWRQRRSSHRLPWVQDQASGPAAALGFSPGMGSCCPWPPDCCIKSKQKKRQTAVSPVPNIGIH